MVDTLVEGGITSVLDKIGLSGPYWSDVNTAIIIFADASTNLEFARTIDKGVTWTTTQVEVGDVKRLSVWYDKETPGDTGTLCHVAWLDNATDDLYYITVDVADGTQGTKRTIDAGVTVEVIASENFVSITKTVGGGLIVCISTQTEIKGYKSSDNFATAATSIASPYEAAADADSVVLFPAETADDNDACCLFADESASTISLKMYDSSADSWTETAIATMVNAGWNLSFDGSIRHSDGHLLIAFHNNYDNVADDLQTYDLTVDSIAGPTITAKTTIFTNQAESAKVSVFINQQNDHVYVAHLKGGTWESTVDVVFHISTDGMGTWGAEQAYSEAVPDDFRLLHSGHSVGDAGGRYQLSFYDDDQTEVMINETNDIEIVAAAPPTPTVVGDHPRMIYPSPPTIMFASVGILQVTASPAVLSVTAVTPGTGLGIAPALLRVVAVTPGAWLAVPPAIVSVGAVAPGVGLGVSPVSVSVVAITPGTGLGALPAVVSVVAVAPVVGVVVNAAVVRLIAVTPTIDVGGVLASPAVISISGVPPRVLGWVDYGPVKRLVDVAHYQGESYFFEVTLKTSDAAAPAHARLFNVTDGVPVTGSELLTTSLVGTRLRSGALTLSASKEYKVQLSAEGL